MGMQSVAGFGVGLRERIDLALGERRAEVVRPAELAVAGGQLLADLREREVAVVDALDVQRRVFPGEPRARG